MIDFKPPKPKKKGKNRCSDEPPSLQLPDLVSVSQSPPSSPVNPAFFFGLRQMGAKGEYLPQIPADAKMRMKEAKSSTPIEAKTKSKQKKGAKEKTRSFK